LPARCCLSPFSARQQRKAIIPRRPTFAPRSRNGRRTSTYRGQPERNFDSLCDLLKRSLNDRTKKFSYALDIKEIIVAGDFAVVRLTWTLTVQGKDASAETIDEPGMDLFRRQSDGSWKIFRYIAYDVSR